MIGALTRMTLRRGTKYIGTHAGPVIGSILGTTKKALLTVGAHAPEIAAGAGAVYGAYAYGKKKYEDLEKEVEDLIRTIEE